VVGKHCLLCAQVAIAGKSILGDHVILYGKVGVSKALKIGDRAVVLASSNVGDDLEGGKTYFGSPAQEARLAWRQYATYRKLPEIWEKFRRL
jgi:UDP-3-O-[3-hydroxymyristoyl] glucosamine N-acyltransferase